MRDLVDAHQHFWRLARGDYAWLTPDLEPLYRDFEPADLAPLLADTGVAQTIAVQAAPTLAETRFLLELARDTPFIAGVVGWVDLAGADAEQVLTELTADPALVGVRPMIQDLPDPEWMLGRDLEHSLKCLLERDLVFDALVRPLHLPVLRRFCERWPDLRVVIDHGAKPDIAAGAFQPWATEMAALARDTRSLCKLSGLLTEAGDDPDFERVRPYAEHLLDCFGAERLLWGSDWPVLTMAGSYSGWWQMTMRLLQSLTEGEREQVLGATARRCYLSCSD